ncbi:MAG TPA: type II toxin-antitoxin system RelE/ParE family toxin [Rhizomicrobium sp.]
MIGSLRNKALRALWEKNDPSGVNPNAAARIGRILSILDGAENIRDLDVPGFRFHALKGYDPRRYSMRVTGNWRVTFTFEVGIAETVELEDYHGS